MVWKNKLEADDNEVILGRKHPMNYAFAIVGIIKNMGYCLVHVRENIKFDHNGVEKNMNDQWDDIQRLLLVFKTVRIMKHYPVRDEKDKACLDYKLEW